MNPYVLLALGAAAVSACGGAFFYGRSVGIDSAEAAAAREERVARIAYESGQQAAAAEIAKIKPRNVTIRQELEREIQTNTVYRDCRVPADGVRLANEALTGITQPAGDRQLPAAQPPLAKP